MGTSYDVKVGKTGLTSGIAGLPLAPFPTPFNASPDTSRFGGYRIESRTVQTVH